MIIIRTFIVALVIILGNLLFVAYAADMNPLSTERAETIGEGKLRFSVEGTVDALDDGTKLYHTPAISLILGIAENADLILNFGGLLYRTGHNFNDSLGPGDLTVGLKSTPIKGDWGSLGFLISTKLPNANDKDGLGTDVQDFHLVGLYSVLLESLRLNFNVGLHVIGDNTERRKYHYLFAYGAGFEYMVTERFSIIGDVSGTTGGDDDFETSTATLGFVAPLACGWEWGVTGSAGLTSESSNWSAGLHVSKTWNLDRFGSDKPSSSEKDAVKLNLYPFPLSTDEAGTIREGSLYAAMTLGVMSFDDDSIIYTAPSLDLRYGLGKGVDVEIEIPYTFLDDSKIYGDTDGLGEIRVGFKISPWQFHLGGDFRFGVLNEIKMPAINDRKGLGLKEMDYMALFLTSATFGRFVSHVNLGLSTEGNPEAESSQNDFFIVGSGAEFAFTDWGSIYGNVSGKIGYPDEMNSFRTEGGLRFLIKKSLILSVSGGSGFEEVDPDWIANFGLSIPFDF